MTITEAGDLEKKQSGFNIENCIYNQDNNTRLSIRDTLTTIDFIGYEKL